jgi:hypothetical protein
MTAMAAGGGPDDNAKIVSVRGPDELDFIPNIQTRAASTPLPVRHLARSTSTSSAAARTALSITPAYRPAQGCRRLLIKPGRNERSYGASAIFVLQLAP